MQRPGTPLQRLRYRLALRFEGLGGALGAAPGRVGEWCSRLRYRLGMRGETAAGSISGTPQRVGEWLSHRRYRAMVALEPLTESGLRRRLAVASAGVVLMGFVAGGAVLIGSRDPDGGSTAASAAPVAVAEARSEEGAEKAKLAAERRTAHIAARRRARVQRARDARARARARAAAARRRRRAPAAPVAPAPGPETLAAEPPAAPPPAPVQPQPVSQPAPAPAPAPAPQPAPQPQGGVTFDDEG
jgi:hypothetical protein